jgi:hypothetical protein
VGLNNFFMTNDSMLLVEECVLAVSSEYTTLRTPARPGESYDPLLMSLVKSTSISVDEGEETDSRRIFKP